MSLFTKERTNRYNQSWLSNITEEELNTLPIVLLGLSDIRHFPIPIECISPTLLKNYPHIQFYNSKITGRRMAAGIATGDAIETGIINNLNVVYDYQVVPDIDEINQIKDYAVQVNYNLDSSPNKFMMQINNISSELEESDNQIYTLADIINHTETEPESKKLIESIIDRNEKEHAGKYEATIHLVN